MKRKREERRKRRRLKLHTLFMLSLTLIFNTFAWFLYVTTVSTNMTVHVDAWSVNFEVDNHIVEKEFIFPIDEAYPGMEDVEKTVKINNQGEKQADLSYTIPIVRILDKTYIVEDELTTAEKATLTGNEIKITEDEMIKMLNEDNPFKIVAICSSDVLDLNGEANVKISFSWKYEAGNDENDTKFGIDSYKYYKDNEGKSAIEVKIKIVAKQHQN